MMTLRQRPILAFVVAWIATASWLMAANHCALMAVATSLHGQHGCCHEPATSGASLDCCATKEAIPPAAVVVPGFKGTLGLPAAPVSEPGRRVPPVSVAALPVHAPGSPPGPSFAELVLQECLRAHAPPRSI